LFISASLVKPDGYVCFVQFYLKKKEYSILSLKLFWPTSLYSWWFLSHSH